MRFLVFLAAGLMAGAGVHAEKTDLQLTGQQGDFYFFAVSKPWSKDQKYVEQVLRNMCMGKPHCFAHIWDKRTGGATKVPMTDKQLDNMLAMYRQNTNTKLSELYFNCKIFPATPKDQCL